MLGRRWDSKARGTGHGEKRKAESEEKTKDKRHKTKVRSDSNQIPSREGLGWVKLGEVLSEQI